MKIFLDADICLDLLDTHREQSATSIALYLHYKDNPDIEFYFSGDFLTTLYYILTENSGLEHKKVAHAIEALATEVSPIYLIHDDFVVSKRKLYDDVFGDLEDLMILESALRTGCNILLTQNRAMLELEEYESIKILSPSSFTNTLNK